MRRFCETQTPSAVHLIWLLRLVETVVEQSCIDLPETPGILIRLDPLGTLAINNLAIDHVWHLMLQTGWIKRTDQLPSYISLSTHSQCR